MTKPTRFRRLPVVESLEERTLLAGNLLATTEVPGQIAYNLMQYTQQGSRVSSQSIPQAPGSNEYEDARGLSVDPSGNVNVFDGTFNPSLATLSATTHTWSFQTTTGWSTFNVVNNGEVAAYKNFVFASDQATVGGQAYGIIRFDSSGSAPVRFAQGNYFEQVTLGLDGNLYGLVGTNTSPAGNPTIEAFNPDTLAMVRSFTLNTGFLADIRSIAVDATGNVYAADWGGTVTKYNSSGNATGTSVVLKGQSGFAENLVNVALDNDGQVAVGGRFGEIYLTNESLTNVQTIQTGQWDAFVTFNHYIGTTPQLVTPVFSALAGPTIPFGTASVTLGGTITAGTAIPGGSVSITVAGMTKSAAINAANGTFSTVFVTNTLGASGSPYGITYSYPGDAHDNAIKDTSKSLTVTKAVTSFTNLASPTIIVGTSSVTVSGVVNSNSVEPGGQTVTLTVLDSLQHTVATGQATIGSAGAFSTVLDSSKLPVGSYSIQYSYAGDANFAGTSGTGTLSVTYAVQALFDTSKAHHPGSTIPIKLEITDASGNPIGDLEVTPVSLVNAQGQSFPLLHRGLDNDNDFKQTGSKYQYNLDSDGFTPGTYTLFVQVGNDPVLHSVTFVIG
jgi:hypothetical protein